VLQSLLDLIARLGDWSYLILFVAAALECAAFAGLVLPEETLVLASGFLARQGLLDLEAVIAVVAVGAMIGDNVGYRLGARLGRTWLLRQGARVGIRPARLVRVEAFFARHGTNAVFLGRFVGMVRTLIPFVAGAAHMPYRQFLGYDALGAILSTATFTVLGYALGASWYLVEGWIGRTSTAVAGAVVALAVLTWLWRRRRARPRTG
jgi:undecaprenyl-diphosphatase